MRRAATAGAALRAASADGGGVAGAGVGAANTAGPVSLAGAFAFAGGDAASSAGLATSGDVDFAVSAGIAGLESPIAGATPFDAAAASALRASLSSSAISGS